MLKLFTSKPERPYLKICSKCHGKGQLSYFNSNQQKTYKACDKCTNGNGITGLGVTLKCTCQEKSCPYEFIPHHQLKFFKGLDEPEIAALKEYQKEMGKHGEAVLLQCDCGLKYLTRDSTQRRKRISGQKGMNEEDKTFNKELAQGLVDMGIARVLRPDGGRAPSKATRVMVMGDGDE